jgi:hypothetical protein
MCCFGAEKNTCLHSHRCVQQFLSTQENMVGTSTVMIPRPYRMENDVATIEAKYFPEID